LNDKKIYFSNENYARHWIFVSRISVWIKTICAIEKYGIIDRQQTKPLNHHPLIPI